MSAGVSTRRSVDDAAQTGRVPLELRDDQVAHLVGVGAVRDPLGEDVHRVVRKGRLEIRPLAQRAVLPAVEGPLDVIDPRRDDDPPAQPLAVVDAGEARERAERRSSTTAVAPGVRMFPARHRSRGPASSGSSQRVSTVFGSTPHATTGASISSPEASATPGTRAAADEQASTPPRRVRTSAPAAVAAASSARASAAGPPLANVVCPAAPPSFPAESARSTQRGAGRPRPHRGEERATRGERAAHRIRREPLADEVGRGHRHRPRQLARGAGARGAGRRGRASGPPASRRSRPSRAAAASPRRARPGTGRARGRGRRTAGRRCRPRGETAASSSAVRAGSAQNVSGAPPSRSASMRTAGRTSSSPWRSSSSSATTAGRSRPTVETTPSRMPPVRSRRSTTTTRRPARARCGGADEPVVAAAGDDHVVAHPRPRDLQVLERGDAARGAHEAAAGMGRRAAHPQAVHRRAVAGPAGHGPVEEELLERQLALEDVALGEADPLLDVERREHLLADDQVADVRSPLGQRVDHGVAERLPALVVPLVAAGEVIRARTGRSSS